MGVFFALAFTGLALERYMRPRAGGQARSAGRVGLIPLLPCAIQRALHHVAFQSVVHLERAAKFRVETLGLVGNAAETALR